MAKILVADDNSNIQKMVVLALKDQGIEVVAVGNGEAAVRKISDVKPDLVLADIFMPVRNGYEVCKFVKDNSALSHIPVILLVGAFDPLDEQEASRVGADGVLKKPFVPPDPLISMVKAALARAGVALGTSASTSTPPPPMPVATKTQPLPATKITPAAPVLVQEPEEDLGTPVFSVPRPSPLTIATSSQPLAFGSLLETATPEDDAAFAISPTTQIAPDRDWSSLASAEEEEEPEESSKTESWRISSAIEETASETPAGQTDWREAAFSGIGSEQAQKAGWAPSIEKNSLAITEEEAAELARKRDGLPAITSSPVLQDWGKAIEAVLPTIPQLKEEPIVQESLAPAGSEPFVAPFLEVPPPPPPVPEVAALPPISQPQEGPNVNSWMAGAINNPWDVESQPASQLAATWDLAKGTSAMSVEQTPIVEASPDTDLTATTQEKTIEPPAVEEASTSTEEALAPELPDMSAIEDLPATETLLSPETKEILQEETAQVVAEEQPQALESAYSGVVEASESASTPAPDMDEIVAKVLARMNPEVLQAVTREILKPLVEAMIKDELTKK